LINSAKANAMGVLSSLLLAQKPLCNTPLTAIKTAVTQIRLSLAEAYLLKKHKKQRS
jgi:hypothetical protein